MAFLIDVVLKGVLEEVGSLVVVLRLWRVIKVGSTLSEVKLPLTNELQIIEELSAGADEQMEPLRDKIEDLEVENRELRGELEELKLQTVA